MACTDKQHRCTTPQGSQASISISSCRVLRQQQLTVSSAWHVTQPGWWDVGPAAIPGGALCCQHRCKPSVYGYAESKQRAYLLLVQSMMHSHLRPQQLPTSPLLKHVLRPIMRTLLVLPALPCYLVTHDVPAAQPCTHSPDTSLTHPTHCPPSSTPGVCDAPSLVFTGTNTTSRCPRRMTSALREADISWW
jgi:hypothetical protein